MHPDALRRPNITRDVSGFKSQQDSASGIAGRKKVDVRKIV